MTNPINAPYRSMGKSLSGFNAAAKLSSEGHPLVLTIEHILTMQPKMTEDEKNSLTEWERVNCGSGGKATTDWPGWVDVSARLSH